MTEHPRWIATIIYATDNGPADVQCHIEELEDLQEVVERGPDWNSIEQIIITLNPHRRSYQVTVEEAREI